MFLDRRHHVQKVVGRRAHVEANAGLFEEAHRGFITVGQNAVPDPFGLEDRYCVDDALRPPAGRGCDFSRVRHRGNPTVATRNLKGALELRRRKAFLRPVEAEADHRRTAGYRQFTLCFLDETGECFRCRHAQLPLDGHHQADPDSRFLLRFFRRFRQQPECFEGSTEAVGVKGKGRGDFDPGRPGRLRVLCHLEDQPLDVGRLAEAVAGRQVDVDKGPEAVEPLVRHVCGNRRYPVFFAEFDEGRPTHGSLQVQVELGFGQRD
mmetsp:Transcript_71855/g.145790  ORF Transcript_71855/g.145790 Transcript_71855/m.145790 type:complete len:264 (+) Transcript_71855:2030-2821(+)